MSWRAKFSSARSNLLNISNIKLIPQKFLQLVDAEYLKLSRKPSLNLWNWNLRTKNLIFRRIFAKKTKLRGNWTLPSSFLKVTARELLPGYGWLQVSMGMFTHSYHSSLIRVHWMRLTAARPRGEMGGRRWYTPGEF